LRIAVCEIGLSVDEFWKLSFYEWQLYQNRLKVQFERERLIQENGWNQTRVLWATIINTTPGIKKRVQPKDLIKLSFDDELVDKKELVPITDKEMKQKFGKLFKNG
jgi:hypothetical protein